MYTNLRKNPKWKPTNKLWYSKYTCSIKLGPFDEVGKYAPMIERPHRQSNSYGRIDGKFSIMWTTIYTTDSKLLEGLTNLYPYEEVHTPMNQKHATHLLDGDHTMAIRQSQWYNQYRYKLECSSWRRWGEKTDEKDLAHADKFIKESFTRKDSRFRASEAWHYGDAKIKLPIIYTNDEASLMLFKLTFSKAIPICITEAVTYDEIKDLA